MKRVISIRVTVTVTITTTTATTAAIIKGIRLTLIPILTLIFPTPIHVLIIVFLFASPPTHPTIIFSASYRS